MNFKPDRKTLVKIGFILLIIAIVPFSFELAFLLDLGGLDLAISFLTLFLLSNYNLLLVKWDTFKRDFENFLTFVAELYMFKPRVFIPHVAASSIVVALTCSLFLACLFWVPVMVASSGFMV